MSNGATYADLEIRIGKAGPAGYPIELTLNHGEKYARGCCDPQTLFRNPAGRQDWVRSGDDRADGEHLFHCLLGSDPSLREAWGWMQGRHPQCRIRLRIDPDAAELHAIPWELLRDSDHDSALYLASSSAMPFSRHLDWGEIGVALTERPVRTLAVLANPDGLTALGLAPLDLDDERALVVAATAALDIELKLFPEPGKPCTLRGLQEELQRGYHILHFVGHGSYSERSGSRLFMAGDDNQVALVPGTAQDDSGFADMIGRLMRGGDPRRQDRLRLVTLASCQTAARSPADAFRGIAPELVRAGVPAVLAMQDLMPVPTAREFSATFYARLAEHGLVDLACNEARAAILASKLPGYELPGAAIPVLFSRLTENRLLGQPERPERAKVIPTKSFEPETILIPAGPFLMGSQAGPGIPEYETPQHEVTLPAYRIGHYPVTNREYAEFIRRERAQDVPKDAGWFLRKPPPDRLDHPVTSVSWHDAVAYCAWLSGQTGHSYHLPSEAEWEKAARSGDGRRYPWGDEWGEGRCNTGKGGTTPVATYPAGTSAYGCEDMLGNVQEWTAALWGAQPGQPQQTYSARPDGGSSITDPADLPAQARLVHRGGSYKSQPGELHCAARGSAAPDSMILWRGFRVAMEIKEQA